MATSGPAVDAVVDNDLILKAVCYCVTSAFWPGIGATRHVGVLGAARYVVSKRVERANLSRDKSMAQAELASFLASVTELEPSDPEVRLAAEMEVAAQREGLPLDAGESQLGAMVIEREIAVLETGDKRAIGSLEQLLDQVGGMDRLDGRVRCLEQLVRSLVEDDRALTALAGAICAEPDVDKTMTICFACRSPQPPLLKVVIEGLESYIGALRREAPRVLAR